MIAFSNGCVTGIRDLSLAISVPDMDGKSLPILGVGATIGTNDDLREGNIG